jgi:hypothetical protein
MLKLPEKGGQRFRMFPVPGLIPRFQAHYLVFLPKTEKREPQALLIPRIHVHFNPVDYLVVDAGRHGNGA